MATVRNVAPFMLVGVVLALLIARPLNAMEMGDDTARARSDV
jgi:iron complex transport system permease protein